MKRKLLLAPLFLLSTLMLFTNCSSNDENNEGEGKITFDLKSDPTFPIKPSADSFNTKATSNDDYLVVTNYDVVLEKADGTQVLSEKYGDMGVTQKLDAGSYSISASMGTNVVAAYDALYVYGETTFTIADQENKNVKINCTPANVKVNVKYSSDFFNYYSDCEVSFSTVHMTTPFKMSKNDSNKDLYLKANNNETLTVTFAFKDKNGAVITPEGFGPKTYTINPRDFVTFNIKPTIIESTGNAGITITVDTSVKEETITITVPGDLLS